MGKPLHFKGSSFHRVITDFMVRTQVPGDGSNTRNLADCKPRFALCSAKAGTSLLATAQAASPSMAQSLQMRTSS